MKKKKNIRKVPEEVIRQLGQIKGKEIIAYHSLCISRQQILNGEFEHLNISFKNRKLNYPEQFIPFETQGKFSKWNVLGREIQRKDLPMETFTISFETPNWGDSSKGTHTVEFERERYPVDFSPPHHISLQIEMLQELSANDSYIFKFTVSEVLDKDSNEFMEELFFCLNILQENVGGFKISESLVSKEEILATYHLGWEILPIGNKDLFMEKVFARKGYTQEDKAAVEERYDFFISLKPQAMIYGSSGLQRYIGAKLADDLVVFENVRYGNALYIMYEQWEILSQKSRLELLRGRFGEDFDRVIHKGEWQEKARNLIESRR